MLGSNFSNPVTEAADLFGRKDKMAEILRAFKSSRQRSIIIIGECMIGKTSLLQVASKWLETKEGYRVLSLPSNAFISRDQFAEELVQRICTTISSDPYQTGLFDSQGRFQLLTLSGYFASLKQLLNLHRGVRLALCIDDFDKQLAIGDDMAVSKILDLLSYLIEKTDLPVRFMGTMTRIPEAVQNSFATTILSSSTAVRLRPWEKEESHAYVRQAIGKRFKLSKHAERDLFAAAGGSPFFTRAIVYSLGENSLRKASGFRITFRHVEQAVEHCLTLPQVGLAKTRICAYFSDDERALLSQLAFNKKPLTSGKNRNLNYLELAGRLKGHDYIGMNRKGNYTLRIGLLGGCFVKEADRHVEVSKHEKETLTVNIEAPELQSILEHLYSTLVRGELVLFVGAGLSVGAGLPSWSELIRPLAKKVNYELPSDPFLTAAHFLTAAQRYENTLDRPALVRHLQEHLNTVHEQPTGVHRLIASLPLQIVFTTNYDDLLERAFAEAERQFDRIVGEQSLPFMRQGNVQVVKLCGDLFQPDTIVLTEHDFSTYFDTHRRLVEHLRTALEKSTALFLGYSLQDPFLNQIWDSIGFDLKQRRFGYALLFDQDSSEVRDLERRGIHAINLATKGQDKSKMLTLFLKRLTEAKA